MSVRFGRLAKQLDIELEAAVMQRVFNEIDEDCAGCGSSQTSVLLLSL